MTLEFQRKNLFFESFGSGDPLVLLHGFLESSIIWKDFIPELSKNRQVVVIDLPGQGKSDVVAEVQTMELQAEAVNEVVKKLNIQKASFIGHSMGGYIGLAFLEKYPEKVERIMLLNSTTEADSEERKEVRDRSAELVKRNKKAYVSMAISNLTTPENSGKFASELQFLKDHVSEFPTGGITANLRGMKIRTDKTEVLRRFEGRKIWVTGKQDPLLDFNTIMELAEGIGSEFHLFPNGHLSSIEDKEKFLNLCISSKI